MSKARECVILGIDPGTVVMGYAVLLTCGREMKLISAGALKLKGEDHHYDRLKTIFEKVLELIDMYHPDEMAIEEPFFGKNVQSMLKLGRAQGVAMAAALYRGLPVSGYSPRLIKQSITGKGSASKEQVAAMLERLVKYKTENGPLDASDALGAAVCHFFRSAEHIAITRNEKKTAIKTGKAGWASFLQSNPERLVSRKRRSD